MNSDQSTVAMYWDFENIHASILDQKKGAGTYKQSRFSSQDHVVDVEALMEFAASLGSVAINRAYGNWQWFSKYREVLLHNAVELIQLFPPGSSAKNGADINFASTRPKTLFGFPISRQSQLLVVTATFFRCRRKSRLPAKHSSASVANLPPISIGHTVVMSSDTTKNF